MTDDRFLVAQFCDDVRQEVGNKLSLMGCYAGELLVEQMPAVLGKLCVQVKVSTPRDKPFERLSVRAVFNEDVIGLLELPLEEANRQLALAVEPETVRMQIGAIMTFSPFLIEREGVIRVEAECESGVVKGGRIRVMLAASYREKLEAQRAQAAAKIASSPP
jgi:hypothetical protein